MTWSGSLGRGSRWAAVAGLLAMIGAAGPLASAADDTDRSTYLATLKVENASDVAIGRDGSAYLLGVPGRSFVPAGGAYDDGPQGGIFAMRLDATGTTMWAARIGGSRVDFSTLQAVDGDGNVYIAGTTRSQDFPTTAGALGERYWDSDRGEVDFVMSLTPDGRELRYAARIPGSLDIGDLLVDETGAAYLLGRAGNGFRASDGAFDSARGSLGSAEGYVAKLTPNGSRLAWSSFVGGSGDDWPGWLAVTATGDLAVTGQTSSEDLPTTAGAAHPTRPAHEGNDSAFAMAVSMDGRELGWSTYLPLAMSEQVTGLAVTRDGGVDVVGITEGYEGPYVRGEPSPGGWILQVGRQGGDLTRIETPILGHHEQTPRGDIIGIGHLVGGRSSDDAVVRLSEDGALVGVSPLPYYGIAVTADKAESAYVILEQDTAAAYATTAARTVTAQTASGPSVARYAPCTITGTRGDDVLIGTPGPDVICGRGGSDIIRARGSYDVVRAGPGRDIVRGGAGVDVLEGGPGADLLVGGERRDLLRGGDGSDVLRGHDGPDRLFGGAGDDRLLGGPGRDFCRDRQGTNVLRSCH